VAKYFSRVQRVTRAPEDEKPSVGWAPVSRFGFAVGTIRSRVRSDPADCAVRSPEGSKRRCGGRAEQSVISKTSTALMTMYPGAAAGASCVLHARSRWLRKNRGDLLPKSGIRAALLCRGAVLLTQVGPVPTVNVIRWRRRPNRVKLPADV